MSQTVQVTQAALEVIDRLEAAHGPLSLHLSGGCCDGSSPVCVMRGELLPTASDRQIGSAGETPFYIDEEQYARWGCPSLVLDVAPGEPSGLSLEGLEGVHFITRSPDPRRDGSDDRRAMTGGEETAA